MKNLKWVLSILLLPAITACSSDTSRESDRTANENEQLKEQTSEFGDIAELLKKSEYTTAEFNRVATFLDGQEMTITGYPYAYPLGEGEEVEFKPGSTQMIDGIDNSVDNVSIRIKFKNEEEPRTMHIGELFGVKGKVEVSYSVSKFGKTTSISISDAVFIEKAEQKAGGIASVAEIDRDKQIFLGDLYSVMDKHFTALNAKSITVSGPFYGKTVSKNLEKTEILEIRIDLGGTDDKVGCEMLEEPDGDKLSAIRAAGKTISIAGKFSGITWGNPRINGGVMK